MPPPLSIPIVVYKKIKLMVEVDVLFTIPAKTKKLELTKPAGYKCSSYRSELVAINLALTEITENEELTSTKNKSRRLAVSHEKTPRGSH